MKKKQVSVEDSSSYTKYEKARIIGARATQISMGAPSMVKLSKKELEAIKYDPIKMAKMELEQGLIPITVARVLPEKRKKKAPKKA